MDAFGIVGGSLVEAFALFHPFRGVVDIIVVEQPDGSYKSSRWYVKFGKFAGVLKAKEKIVTINVNGIDMEFNMYLDHNGKAYFLHESKADEGESKLSPSSSGEDTDVASSVFDISSNSNSVNLVQGNDSAMKAEDDHQKPVGEPLVFNPLQSKGNRIKSMVSSALSPRFFAFPKRSESVELPQPVANSSASSDVDNNLKSTKEADDPKDVPTVMVAMKTVRLLTPTSEQLATLHLKEGKNIVKFILSTAVLGRQQVEARIYLWRWDTRIVISDVDGTITRSDVLGQVMPWVGVDWTQTGVTNLFAAIKENGYQLLFLSARAISQAYLTRQFLFNIKQDGKSLPDGPVIISPDGVFPSLYREVVRRAPHEFKIACLEDIKALFPSDSNPFYAGFGNRDTDELSYLKVGIPLGKIFIINPKGEIVVNRQHDAKSYTSLHVRVNGVFPPTSSTEQEDFNSWILV